MLSLGVSTKGAKPWRGLLRLERGPRGGQALGFHSGCAGVVFPGQPGHIAPLSSPSASHHRSKAPARASCGVANGAAY